MSINWGAWEYASGNGMRVGVDLYFSPSKPTSSTTSVTVTRKWYIEDQYSYSDSQTLTYGGSDSGSTNFTNSMGSSGGTKLVSTRTSTVTLTSSSQSKTYSATISGAYNGVTPSESETITIPAKPYAIPAAPTAVTAARVSDTQQTVTWTRNSTSAAPYTTQNVQRYDADTDVWSTIATGISGSATSYSDKTTAINKAYKYRIQAKNTAGTSTSASTADYIFTTPNPPTAAKATKDAGGGIVVSWTNKSGYVSYLTEIWESQDGGPYAALITNVASGVTSYLHAAPNPAVTHQYQVRHKTTVPVPTLFSTYATTEVVQLAAPPNAPSDLQPNGVVLDADLDIHATWIHNPVDSSPQTKWQGRSRIVGDPTWNMTGEIVSPLSEAILPGGTYPNGVAVEWEIQTWGVHPDPSPWSATAVFNSSSPPSVSITSPADGAVLVTSTLTVTWSYFDTEGTPQTGWRANLIQDGNVIESRVAANDATTATFETPILDGITYTIEVTVRDGDGLISAPDTITISVEYLPPADVDCEATYDEETGVVVINLFPQAPVDGSTVPAALADIERRIDGGRWILIASKVPADATILDIAPGIHNTNEYRVTVYSDIPSSAVMVDTCIVETCEINRGFLSTGQEFENIIVIDGAVGVAVTSSRDKALHHFAGRRYAVEFMGTALDKVVNVTGTLYEENGTATDMEDAGQTNGIVLWRDPSGRRIFGSIGPVSTTLVSMSSPNVWTTGFPVSEVDYAG